MSSGNDGNEQKRDVTEAKKKDKPQKELTPQEIQKRKKMLIYPLFFLIFLGVMWLIFAPSENESEQLADGFNPELPIPKDEAIVGDKRTAYEQEAMRNKQENKRRSLQDFTFTLAEEDNNNQVSVSPVFSDYQENTNSKQASRSTIQSSTHAYQNVNRQLNSWYEQPANNTNERSQAKMEGRIEELERKLSEAEAAKSAEDRQLELIEKSYQIAAKYTPNGQGQATPNELQEQTVINTAGNTNEKVIPKPVSHVHHNVVSLLAAPMSENEFMEQYGKPRNMGFITAAGNEAVTEKNAIRACVYQTVTLSDGKELQLRLLEPMLAGKILIPANSIITGSCRIGGERLEITISSIQYANNIIPVELQVYDADGQRGIFIPNSDEVKAAKEVAAQLAQSAGTSISITDNAGSQLAADMGKGLIQGASQYVSKKMSVVKVTIKANHRLLLLPKA